MLKQTELPSRLNDIFSTITFSNGDNLQQPADVAVICQTLMRPTLKDTIQSILKQDFKGSVHIVLGIDKNLYPETEGVIKKLMASAPPTTSTLGTSKFSQIARMSRTSSSEDLRIDARLKVP